VADDAGDFGIDQLLGHGVADLGIGLVVFLETSSNLTSLDRPSLGLGGVGFVDRQARAVLVVLAQMRDAAGERRRRWPILISTEGGGGGGACTGGRRGRLRFLVFAATGHGDARRSAANSERAFMLGTLHATSGQSPLRCSM
jgi:hypothetical protein